MSTVHINTGLSHSKGVFIVIYEVEKLLYNDKTSNNFYEFVNTRYETLNHIFCETVTKETASGLRFVYEKQEQS